ncbi:octanoyltransferase, partial [Proteus mirabilis]
MKIFTVQDKTIIIRQLGIQPYLPVSDSMHQFTEKRESHTPDEIW